MVVRLHLARWDIGNRYYTLKDSAPWNTLAAAQLVQEVGTVDKSTAYCTWAEFGFGVVMQVEGGHAQDTRMAAKDIEEEWNKYGADIPHSYTIDLGMFAAHVTSAAVGCFVLVVVEVDVTWVVVSSMVHAGYAALGEAE